MLDIFQVLLIIGCKLFGIVLYCVSTTQLMDKDPVTTQKLALNALSQLLA